MLAVITVLVVVVLSLLVTKVGAVALSLTGMDQESARFQARSAFSGAGFTTTEAEAVVDHPVRRRIISTLILLGSAGLVSAIATLLLTFSGGDGARWKELAGLMAGLAVLFWIAKSPRFDRWLTVIIRRVLRDRTDLEVRDFESLLQLQDGWSVSELTVEPQDWLADHSLIHLDLPREGVLVLGIRRADGRWIGSPRSEAVLRAGDVAVLYGPSDAIVALDQRVAGRQGETQRAAAIEEFQEYRESHLDEDVPGAR